jgi:hypothetical protein
LEAVFPPKKAGAGPDVNEIEIGKAAKSARSSSMIQKPA